jgi:hypothetical protein
MTLEHDIDSIFTGVLALTRFFEQWLRYFQLISGCFRMFFDLTAHLMFREISSEMRVADPR